MRRGASPTAGPLGMNLDLIVFRPEEPHQPRINVSSLTQRIDDKRVDVVIRIELEKGVHLYASPAPEGFEALDVEVLAAEGLVVGQPRYPAPTATADGASAHEDLVQIAIPVILSSAEKPPTLEVQVRYQACTEAACFPPKVERLVIDVQ